ncbi:MAG: hypothetical protein H6837_08830 [Planctomycetes bacterium]|nr:hypothetical protein [Planctomycetota bacterium]
MHDQRDFEQLFAAFTNAELTAEETARLRALAAPDVGRRGAVAEVEAVHELFAAEAALRADTLRPVEPVEEASEGFQRLARAAGRAEQRIRDRLAQPSVLRASVDVTSPRRVRRVVWLAAAGLLLVVLAGILTHRGGQPALDLRTPDRAVLGHDRIHATSTLSARSAKLAWTAVAGANHYHAVILDETQAVLLQRAASERRETEWGLTAVEFARLRSSRGPLALQVVAFDRDGREVGRTEAGQQLRLLD